MTNIIKNIMVYVDSTEEAVTAGQYAICLAKQMDCSLHALYVVNTKSLSDLVAAKIFIEEEEEEYKTDIETDAKRYLKHIEDLAKDKNVAIETHRASGSAVQQILEKARSLEIDLLILGGISKIRSRRDDVYDETERALRRAGCSVLIVKDQERVWDIYDSL